MINETSPKKDSVEEIESISNWTIWQPSCAISLFKDTEDNTYNATIDLILTDEPMRCITTVTQIWCKDPLCVVRQAFESVYALYEDVAENVIVIDYSEGNVLEEEYTISEAFEFNEYVGASNEISLEM